MNLTGKTAIITGASREIGRAIALEMAKEGANLCLVYKSHEAQAKEVLREVKKLGRKYLLLQGDISKYADTARIAEETFCKFKAIDILVNNAGITSDYSFAGMEPAEWQRVLDTNLTGTFNICQCVAKYMIMRKKGKIINISSVTAQKGGRGQVNYIASKGGLEAMTRALAIELASRNITVNAIAPGVIETEMSAPVITKNRERMLAKILLNRFGRPEEVAKLAVYLTSVAADYITGEVININGGFGLTF